MTRIHKIYGPPKFGRRQLVRELTAVLKGRVHQAYVFGSYATNTATSSSDLDLLLIAESRRTFFERFRDFTDIVERFAPIDMIVYTPAEWEAILRARRQFWLNAKRTWIPLLTAPDEAH